VEEGEGDDEGDTFGDLPPPSPDFRATIASAESNELSPMQNLMSGLGQLSTRMGSYFSPAEVEQELKRIGHELKPLEIVVVNTRAGSRYGNDDYVNAGCGMGYDATIYLLEKGVRLTGTDAWSWDAPFYFTSQKWAKDHDASIIWEGHKAGRDIGYCHLEKLHNLEALPGDGFTIACFPHKIRGASAGWTRAVAIFEE
jgi:kynurenine formamidase